MNTEVPLIERPKNILVAIFQGAMVKILQHIWQLQALKKSYHTMMKNYWEQGRACGSTTMILYSLGQTPGVNYSLLIAIFFKNSNFPFTCTVCDKICMFKPKYLEVINRTTISFTCINVSFIIVLIPIILVKGIKRYSRTTIFLGDTFLTISSLTFFVN